MALRSRLSSGDSGTKHAQLSEKVASRIREAIMSGELGSPDFIRTEQLASDLGVSPTPVREALMVLASEGTVRWEPRRGFRVVPLSAQDVTDVFAVQAHLAGELAARAAEKLTDEQIADLQAIQKDSKAALAAGDVATTDRLNHEFHRIINSASGSTRLANMLRNIVQHVPLSSYAEVDGWTHASATDHVRVLRALRARDPEAARVAMTRHIVHCGDLLLAHVKRTTGLT